LIEKSEGDIFIIEGENYRWTSVINSLSQLNTVEVGQNTVRITNEMLVDEIHKLVLGAVLHLIVVLGLAEGGEFFGSLELVQVDLNLSRHTLTSHGLTSIAEEIEIIDTTDNLKIMHDALTYQISLLRISKNSDGLIQVSVAST
jgi:hypothetical protein